MAGEAGWFIRVADKGGLFRAPSKGCFFLTRRIKSESESAKQMWFDFNSEHNKNQMMTYFLFIHYKLILKVTLKVKLLHDLTRLNLAGNQLYCFVAQKPGGGCCCSRANCPNSIFDTNKLLNAVGIKLNLWFSTNRRQRSNQFNQTAILEWLWVKLKKETRLARLCYGPAVPVYCPLTRSCTVYILNVSYKHILQVSDDFSLHYVHKIDTGCTHSAWC